MLTKYSLSRAHFIIFMSALFLFYKYILQFSPSVMTNDLQRAFHIHGTGLGNLAATYFYTYLVAQCFVGPMLDRFSIRRLVTLAITLTAFSMGLFAYATTLWMAEFSRALIGIGAAFATVSYLKLSSTWFSSKHYPVLAGFLATAASIGAIIGKAPLAFGVAHFGWQTTLKVCAFCGILIAILYYLIVRDHPSQNSQVIQPTKRRSIDILQVLSNKTLWLIALYSGLAWAPLAVFGGLWGNPFLQEAYHLNTTEAAGYVTLAFIGLACGGPAFGTWASDKKQQFKAMIIGLILSFISLGLIIAMPFHAHRLLALNLFVFGFGTGAFMLGFNLGRQHFHAALAGTVIAVINTGDALFGALSEPLVGWILDKQWGGTVRDGVHYFSVTNYQHALILLVIYLLLAVFCLFKLRSFIKN